MHPPVRVRVLLAIFMSVVGIVTVAAVPVNANVFPSTVVKVQPPKGKAGAEARKGIQAWNRARSGYQFRVTNNRRQANLILAGGPCRKAGNARRLQLGRTVTARVPRCKKYGKTVTMRVIARALGLPFTGSRCALMSRTYNDCTPDTFTAADRRAIRALAQRRNRAVRTAPRRASIKLGYVDHVFVDDGWDDWDDDWDDWDDWDDFASLYANGDFDDFWDDEDDFDPSDDVFAVAFRLRLAGAKNMFTWNNVQLRFQGIDDPILSWTEPVTVRTPLLTVPKKWTRNLRVIVRDVTAGAYRVIASARNVETGRTIRSSPIRINVR